MKHILRCQRCSRYTLDNSCPNCNAPTALIKPPKFSPEDKYGEYRRKVKRAELTAKGLY